MLEWVAMPSSRGSSRPRDRTLVSWVFCIGRRVSLPPGKPGICLVMPIVWSFIQLGDGPGGFYCLSKLGLVTRHHWGEKVSHSLSDAVLCIADIRWLLQLKAKSVISAAPVLCLQATRAFSRIFRTASHGQPKRQRGVEKAQCHAKYPSLRVLLTRKREENGY